MEWFEKRDVLVPQLSDPEMNVSVPGPKGDKLLIPVEKKWPGDKEEKL